MPKIVYKESESMLNEVIPIGDYKFKVLHVNSGVVEKGKQQGEEMFKLRVRIYSDDEKDLTDVTEILVFAESTMWKLFTFLRCANFNGGTLNEGEELDIEPHMILGLRGWCKVGKRTYEKSTGERDDQGNFLTKPVEVNDIKMWYTDREKLPRDQAMIPRNQPQQPSASSTQAPSPAAPSEPAGEECPF